MDSISELLTKDHQRCDQLFADLEAALGAGDLERADKGFADFARAMERHLGSEEEALFPALESRIGAGGPTEVMRMEHGMMRDLFQELRQELGRRNGERCLGLCETLLVLMQQHNLKEEQILYRMADNILADERPRLLVRLAASA